jgi:hypothetical protein
MDDDQFVNQQAQTSTGTVVSLWRYPVKSMMGEELNSSYVTERGLVGGSHLFSNRQENWQSG